MIMRLRLLKYWWWYNVVVRRNKDHEDLKWESYYHRGWWQLDSQWMAHKLRCKFRLCEKIFNKSKVKS